MGVMGTWCQICGLPVQHDHYVPGEDGYWSIYHGRASGDLDQYLVRSGLRFRNPEECEPAIAFGPEHDWLLDAVGVRLDLNQRPAVIEGEVHNGYFETAEDGMVADGIDERAALHRVCWDLVGQPNPWPLGERIPHDVEPYCRQLFEFAALVGDGSGWMLVDPRLDTPDARASRARILHLAQPAWEGRMPLRQAGDGEQRSGLAGHQDDLG